MTVRNDGWFDGLWENLEVDEEDGINAIRILAEMFDDRVYWRDGDRLIGNEGKFFNLTKVDQFLVRQIIDAVVEITA